MSEQNLIDYDIRVIERRLRDGKLSREQYKAWLDALPDESAESRETDTRISTRQTPAAPADEAGA